MTATGGAIGRRNLGRLAAGLAAVTLLPRPGAATPDRVQASIRDVFGDRPVTDGRIALKIPQIAENGSSIGVTVSAETPPRVTRIMLLADGNPNPEVAIWRFGPRSAAPMIEMRLRLAKTQRVIAIAETEDGRLYRAAAEVLVTYGSCVDEPA